MQLISKIVANCFITVFLLIACQTSYRTTQKEYTDANFQNIEQLKIGMSLIQVQKIMKIKYSWEAQYPNPEYFEHLSGKDSLIYLVYFFRYQKGASGNLVYNDNRFYPVILTADTLIALGWEGFKKYLGEKIISKKGESRVSSVIPNNSERKTGSGFVVSDDGIIVTNYHVVANESNIKAYFSWIDKEFVCKLKIKDEKNDLAILQINDSTFRSEMLSPINYTIANTQNIKVGQDVFTLGFPLGNLMGSKPRLSVGTISSLYGIEDDPRVFQISNPVQPGNSGGPLFNYRGELVGIVVSGLNAVYFLYYSGIVPQNVNFAIKVNYLNTLLELVDINLQEDSSKEKTGIFPLEDLVNNYENYIVFIKVNY